MSANLSNTKSVRARLSRKKVVTKPKIPEQSPISKHTRSKGIKAPLSMPTLNDIVGSNSTPGATSVVPPSLSNSPHGSEFNHDPTGNAMLPNITTAIPASTKAPSTESHVFKVPLSPPVILENTCVTISVTPATQASTVLTNDPSSSPTLVIDENCSAPPVTNSALQISNFNYSHLNMATNRRPQIILLPFVTVQPTYWATLQD